MVYSNRFVMSVLVKGIPQKELANGVVKMPFGEEYCLRFRNKNNRRAVVHILIDGEDVSGNGYIIPANDYIDIKRHHDIDRSFKFVSLDSPEAVDFGKNGPNEDKVKGTIEARFYLEKEKTYIPTPVEHHHHHHHYPRPRPTPVWPVYPQPIWMTEPTYRVTCDSQPQNMTTCSIGGQSAGNSTGRSLRSKGITSNDMSSTCSFDGGSKLLNFGGSLPQNALENAMSGAALKDGCTVEGDTTGQRFTSQWIDVEDNYTTLKLFLQGYEDHVEEVVSVPKKGRKTNKDMRLSELEAENEALRKKLAEAENEELKKKLAQKEKSKAPRKTRAKKKKPE